MGVSLWQQWARRAFSVTVSLLLDGLLQSTNAVQLEQVVQRGGEIARKNSALCVSNVIMCAYVPKYVSHD
jgi:hypothetical protein